MPKFDPPPKFTAPAPKFTAPAPKLSPTLQYLCAKDAARLLGLSYRTLEKHRHYGTGPLYTKVGGRILYVLSDIIAWTERARRRAVSDPTAKIIHPAKRFPPPSESDGES